MSQTQERDPFAPIEASPRFAHPLAVLGIVFGLIAAFNLVIVAGPIGMALGLVAHVKGSRLGIPASGVAAVGMIAGMAVVFYLR